MNLSIPTVALETYDLFHLVDGSYRCIADSPHELRARLHLHDDTQILLRGTAKDKFLERFWAYRRRDGAPAQLSALGVVGAIGPNFSHFLGVPRTDNLYNRKRQLICLEEFQLAGLSPIPHLNTVTPSDWEFWKDYLQRNEGITYVSVEFQTGNQNAAEGKAIIDRLAWLQDSLGRTLHPILVGAARFVGYMAPLFSRFSILDSRPFMSAIKRRILRIDAGKPLERRWVFHRTGPGEPIDTILTENVRAYSHWLEKHRETARTQK